MPKKSKKLNNKKFLISFIITLTTCFVFVGGLYALVSRFISEPDIPTYVIFQFPDDRPNGPDNPDTPASIVVDDDNIGEFLSGEPEVRTEIFERRPGFFTFILYGMDEGVNLDSIMVASFDSHNREVNIISLPRDTRVESNRRTGQSKLVAAYAFGRLQGRGHEGGINQLKTEVSTLIGFRPDFYIGVELEAFIRIIDGLGGVEVTVPFHMRYTDPYQNLRIDIPAGTQRLNGIQASHFARFRMADSGFRAVTDFQRVEHQQMILSAIMQEMLSPRTITQIPEFIRIYNDHVTTNIPNDEMAWFGTNVVLNGINSINTYTLPIARTERSGWYEMPDREAILELVNRTINPFEREITAEMLRIVS